MTEASCAEAFGTGTSGCSLDGVEILEDHIKMPYRY